MSDDAKDFLIDTFWLLVTVACLFVLWLAFH